MTAFAIIIGYISIGIYIIIALIAFFTFISGNLDEQKIKNLPDEELVKHYKYQAGQKYLIIISLLTIVGVYISIKYYVEGSSLLGVIVLSVVGFLMCLGTEIISNNAGRKALIERKENIAAQKRAQERRERKIALDNERKQQLIEQQKEKENELFLAQKELERQQDEEQHRRAQAQTEYQKDRIKVAENAFFEFFNNSQFAIDFIDEPSKQNNGFPEIGWVFNGMKGQDSLVPTGKNNAFTSFLKRQEFSIHVMRNRGTMYRNPRDVIASDAIEIYTHRKMDDYRFIDKEANMNITMNYYVYISLRVDNIDMEGDKPIARLEEYDWSTRPLKSDNRHYAYFEFDSHRVTREEFVGEVARKQQELDERKELSRLKEMEDDLNDAEGGAANRLRRAAEKFKTGGLKQSKALDETEKQLLDEFEASGANEEEIEKFFEVLRKLRRDIEA